MGNSLADCCGDEIPKKTRPRNLASDLAASCDDAAIAPPRASRGGLLRHLVRMMPMARGAVGLCDVGERKRPAPKRVHGDVCAGGAEASKTGKLAILVRELPQLLASVVVPAKMGHVASAVPLHRAMTAPGVQRDGRVQSVKNPPQPRASLDVPCAVEKTPSSPGGHSDERTGRTGRDARCVAEMGRTECVDHSVEARVMSVPGVRCVEAMTMQSAPPAAHAGAEKTPGTVPHRAFAGARGTRRARDKRLLAPGLPDRRKAPRS